MVPAQQRGMASPGMGPVRLSELEGRIVHAAAELDRWMKGTPDMQVKDTADGPA
jgi:hypothetical protein